MLQMKNDASKGNIRTQMNLIFAMMRLLATILDLAIDSQMVCDTLDTTVEGIIEQTAILYRDVKEYTSVVSCEEIKDSNAFMKKKCN